MFTQTWNKYLPVIRILLKRAVNEDQLLRMNTSDFQKAATIRKSGYRFSIEFVNGKPANIIGLPEIAKDLSSVLLLDPVTRELLAQHNYTVSFDSKYQLTLKKVADANPEPAIAVLESTAE